MEVTPRGGVDRFWIVLGNQVIIVVISRVRVGIFKKEITLVFSRAPVDGDEVFGFGHVLVPFGVWLVCVEVTVLRLHSAVQSVQHFL
jgi:hypothetical protein